jgi:hypothetical protein
MYFRLEMIFNSVDDVEAFQQYALWAMRRNPLPLVLMCALLGSPALTREKYPEPAGQRPPGEGEKWAQSTLKKLSLEEKVGQLFMIRLRVELLGRDSPEYLRLRDNIRQYHTGALAMSVPADGHFRCSTICRKNPGFPC